MNVFSRGVRNAFRNGIRTVSVVLILSLAIGLALAMLVAKNAVNKETTKINASIAAQEKNIGTSLTVSTGGQFGGGMEGDMGGGSRSNSSSSSSTTTLTSADLTTIQKLQHVSSANAILDASVTGQGDSSSNNDSSTTTTANTSLTAPTITMSEGASGRFGGSGMSSSSSTSTPTFKQRISLIGISGSSASDSESIITNYLSSESTTTSSLKLSSGSMISGSGDGTTAVIGDQLASANNLKVGSTFTLYGKTITVGGILSSGSSSSSSSSTPAGRNSTTGTAIILPLATVQSLTSQSGQISKIVVTVDNINNVSSVSSKITSVFGDDSNGNSTVSVRSQQSNTETIIKGFNEQKTAIASVGTTALISLIACSIAAAIIVLLTMLMIVRERRNEIGVLKAIGAKTRVIVVQFIAESLVLTLLASAIGLCIGIAAATPLTNTLVSSATSTTTNSSTSNSAPSSSNSSTPGGQNSGNKGGGMGGFAGQTTKAIGNVTANIDWTIVLDAVGAAIIIAAVGATGASLAAVRVKPAEAIRAE